MLQAQGIVKRGNCNRLKGSARMNSRKGSQDAFNTRKASIFCEVGSLDDIEPLENIVSSDSSPSASSQSSAAKPITTGLHKQQSSAYVAMLHRSQYPSRWRFLTTTVAVIVSAAVIFTYAALDVCDIAPGPLTLQTQRAATASSPRALLYAPTLAKGVNYSRPINRAQAQKLINAVMADPSISSSSSAVIMDAQGRVIASHEPNALREPASTLKTLTAAVASRTLDMGSTLDTQVFLLPETSDVPTHASSAHARKLVLRGNGDMLLGVGENDWHHVNGRAGLTTLARRTAAALKLDNIHKVSLSVDDSLFGAKRAPALVYDTDVEHRFYARTSSLAIDDARQRDLVAQGVDADAMTDFPLSDPQPAQSVGNIFARLLEKQGISVVSSAEYASVDQQSQKPVIPVSRTRQLVTSSSRLLAQVSSAPLNEIMAYMLRISDNTLAEEFGRLTAIAVHKRNSPEGAVQAVEEGLRKLHVNTRGLHMSDCSGLSPKSKLRVATLAQVQALNVQAHSGGAAAAEGLSLPGLVGTARKRLADESAAGMLRVKTGSLSDVTSMTGNVSRNNGGVLTFAIVVNQPTDFWGAFVAINKFMAELPKL